MPKSIKHLSTLIVLLFLFQLAWSCLPCSAQAGQAVSSPPALDAKVRSEIAGKVGELLTTLYIFPGKAVEMKALLDRKLGSGGYDNLADANLFARTLTEDLRSVSKDLHLRVLCNPELVKRIRAQESQGAEEREKERRAALERERRDNFGFRKLELLDGNIGYLDLRSFSGLREAGETAVAAMNFLSNAGAVIIDLRRNGGGSPAMIQLISSYFLGDYTYLNSFENRGENTFQQFWSLPYVPGKSMFDKDLYILTSRNTFSAAEEFTYNMKNLKRAALVGETTGGGAHPGGLRIVNDDFLVWIPTGRAVNPITKTNWEGAGIAPDIAVDQDKALDKARVAALEKMIKTAPDETARAGLAWALNALKAKLEPASVEEAVLRPCLGRYAEGEIALENGQIVVSAQGQKIKMIPLSPTYFVPADDSGIQIEFVPDKNGKSYDVIGHFRGGAKQRMSRIREKK